ncbi:vacuolar-sorting SNF8-like [Paramuricea clavata]|nr:vacuolar-sorting SNF8-like [Paramuricea clavata]
MSKQLESFKTYLEEFATKHKSDIKKNAEFRGHFQQMCARIGVDPLASSKGFWAEMLGVGDFYYENCYWSNITRLAKLYPKDDANKNYLVPRFNVKPDSEPAMNALLEIQRSCWALKCSPKRKKAKKKAAQNIRALASEA